MQAISRPRGRPKVKDLEALQKRLLACGWEAFSKCGYAKATMAEIAGLARVSKTTLYSRFPSKAHLFAAIITSKFQPDRDPLDSAGAVYETVEQMLQAFGDMMLQTGTATENVLLSRLLHSESDRFPELRAPIRQRFRREHETLKYWLTFFADRDEIPCKNPSVAADMYLTMLTGWVTRTMLCGAQAGPKERQTWLEEVIAGFVGGRAAW